MPKVSGEPQALVPERRRADRIRHAAMVVLAALLGIGFVLRSTDFPGAGWMVAACASALAFIFVMPAMGARARAPSDSPERKAYWGG